MPESGMRKNVRCAGGESWRPGDVHEVWHELHAGDEGRRDGRVEARFVPGAGVCGAFGASRGQAAHGDGQAVFCRGRHRAVEDRALYHSSAPGWRGDGRGLAGLGPGLAPRRGHQNPAAGSRRQIQRSGPISPRGPVGGPAASHQCGDRLPGGCGRRNTLYRHGIRPATIARCGRVARQASRLAHGDPCRARCGGREMRIPQQPADMEESSWIR